MRLIRPTLRAPAINAASKVRTKSWTPCWVGHVFVRGLDPSSEALHQARRARRPPGRKTRRADRSTHARARDGAACARARAGPRSPFDDPREVEGTPVVSLGVAQRLDGRKAEHPEAVDPLPERFGQQGLVKVARQGHARRRSDGETGRQASPDGNQGAPGMESDIGRDSPDRRSIRRPEPPRERTPVDPSTPSRSGCSHRPDVDRPAGQRFARRPGRWRQGRDDGPHAAGLLQRFSSPAHPRHRRRAPRYHR